MAHVKRSYTSLQRQRQARATRERITTSARRLFAQHGFATTTMEDIARDAEVAVQTVYAAFGSKRGILLALLDSMESEQPAISDEMDPIAQIRQWAHAARLYFERGADLIDIVWKAGLADPDLLAAWREGERRRRANVEERVRGWVARELLRPGLSEQEATDIVWTLHAPEVFRLFVNECHWSGERYEAWLASEMEALLHRPA
ncbi:TetR family transcriptional regulator [Thermosporothrix hazakensis]|uniref:TetR family transcriptional regulator n=1 Tax=Thermosporothrix hazakensis TaxID=644383 RepID=A0A326U926_THEHA|nr:TetR/AcrR family transcriptional regulator [Thermosporothrix hazakensis]PZW32621.1 TetR family transcriptional regulator [Thermosporothrix hazakensis]GCE49975.1 TetR family transcriptional regulator [Thermosporothrix hazakensis]